MKMQITVSVNGRRLDEFSLLCVGTPRSTEVRKRANDIVNRLIAEIPQQTFEVDVGASFGDAKKPFIT